MLFRNTELRATLSLAMIFIFRMLGLFMILPVFTPYAGKLNGATPTLIGVALGIYGLSQALFQMPLGMLSDRIGRKSVITLGLIVFALGSLVAALATSIDGVILGRALQGAGAVGSTTMALVADLTTPQQRTKAMAVIGLSIGLSFALAMILGPLLNAWIAISGIFWVTAGLALLGIGILFSGVPKAPAVFHRDVEPFFPLLRSTLCQAELLRLNLGIFTLHAILTASFVAIPLLFANVMGLPSVQQWPLYLGLLAVSFLLMLPLIVMAEKHHRMKLIFLAAIVALLIAELLLWAFYSHFWAVTGSLLLFFTAFNLLEACLPSLVSKIAPINGRGTAMGIYSTTQFLGIFVGGSAGGWILGHWGLSAIFIFCTFLASIWLVAATRMGVHTEKPISNLNAEVEV